MNMNTNNTNNTIINPHAYLDNLRRQLEAANTLSESLYTIFKLECKPDNDLRFLDPTLWIYNQDQLRKNWEYFLRTYKGDSTKLLNEDKYVKEFLTSHAFMQYFQFMYDFYPPGFGKSILRAMKEPKEIDGAKLFYKCKYGKEFPK